MLIKSIKICAVVLSIALISSGKPCKIGISSVARYRLHHNLHHLPEKTALVYGYIPHITNGFHRFSFASDTPPPPAKKLRCSFRVSELSDISQSPLKPSYFCPYWHFMAAGIYFTVFVFSRLSRLILGFIYHPCGSGTPSASIL